MTKNSMSFFLLMNFFLSCGNDPIKNDLPPNLPGPMDIPTATEESEVLDLRTTVELNGRYISTVAIINSSSPDSIEIIFATTGLKNVKQFEIHIQLEPQDVFDLTKSEFIPFVTQFLVPFKI